MGLTAYMARFFGFGEQRPRAEVAAMELGAIGFDGFARGTHSGAHVTPESALRNPTVYRCVSIISNAIGMLPLHVLRGPDQNRDKATDHPLFDLLTAEPNPFQTAAQFKTQMQAHALIHGNAYARVVRQGKRVQALIPLDPRSVRVKLDDSFMPAYTIGNDTLPRSDIFHLRGLSLDGLSGVSLVNQAAEAIGIALQADIAAARLFRQGTMVGGALTHPDKLSEEAYRRLVEAIEMRHAGAENVGRTMILEEGMKFEVPPIKPSDMQHLDTRRHQVEEIARIFGVPRPLLGLDSTGWGTGIAELGIGFVRYTLAPWFVAWEQEAARTLLTKQERGTLDIKFNEGALIRGSLGEQADFWAKALGSGGHSPWMTVNEVRALMNLAPLEEQNDDSQPA